MNRGMQWLLKNSTILKNDINLPSSFYLHGQLCKSQGWVMLTARVRVSKAGLCICIKISISCLLLSNITLSVKALSQIAF